MVHVPLAQLLTTHKKSNAMFFYTDRSYIYIYIYICIHNTLFYSLIAYNDFGRNNREDYMS